MIILFLHEVRVLSHLQVIQPYVKRTPPKANAFISLSSVAFKRIKTNNPYNTVYYPLFDP